MYRVGNVDEVFSLDSGQGWESPVIRAAFDIQILSIYVNVCIPYIFIYHRFSILKENEKLHATRMHSSRMRTVRCSNHLGGCLPGGYLPGVCMPRGVSARGVCPGSVCPEGICPGYVCLGGVCPGGVCLGGLLSGVSAHGGVCRGGVLSHTPLWTEFTDHRCLWTHNLKILSEDTDSERSLIWGTVFLVSFHIAILCGWAKRLKSVGFDLNETSMLEYLKCLIETITGFCGYLRLLIRDQLTDLSF